MEEFKEFDIDIENINYNNELFNNIQKAIMEMNKKTLKDRFEVILNNNLIECKEKASGFRTIFGCRITYDDLNRNISFIVREDEEPSYEQLQDRIDKAIEYIEKYADEYFTCVEDTEVWDIEIKDLYEILKGAN